MALGGSDNFLDDMQASALAFNLGKVSLGGSSSVAGKGRDVPAVKYQLKDLEIQQTIGKPYNVNTASYVGVDAAGDVDRTREPFQLRYVRVVR